MGSKYTRPDAALLASWDWQNRPCGPPPLAPDVDDFKKKNGQTKTAAFNRAQRQHGRAMKRWQRCVRQTNPANIAARQENVAAFLQTGGDLAEAVLKFGLQAVNSYLGSQGAPGLPPDWEAADLGAEDFARRGGADTSVAGGLGTLALGGVVTGALSGFAYSGTPIGALVGAAVGGGLGYYAEQQDPESDAELDAAFAASSRAIGSSTTGGSATRSGS